MPDPAYKLIETDDKKEHGPGATTAAQRTRWRLVRALVFCVAATVAVSSALAWCSLRRSHSPTLPRAPASANVNASDGRVWPERFASSWQFVRTRPALPWNSTNQKLVTVGRFYYDWTNKRGLLTQSRCPTPLPTLRDDLWAPYPCDTLFVGPNICKISHNETDGMSSCCKWWNPWNATVTPPDWIVRSGARHMGTDHRVVYETDYWRTQIPFQIDYGVLSSDMRRRMPMPYFLDMYDHPDDPGLAIRFLTPDVELIPDGGFGEALFRVPTGCDVQCPVRNETGELPPNPSPDAILYPHYAGMVPREAATAAAAASAAREPRGGTRLSDNHPSVGRAVHRHHCPFMSAATNFE